MLSEEISVLLFVQYSSVTADGSGADCSTKVSNIAEMGGFQGFEGFAHTLLMREFPDEARSS